MKQPLNRTLSLGLAALATLIFSLHEAHAETAPVGVKCEIIYFGTTAHRGVRTLKLKKTKYEDQGVNYSFDQVESLKVEDKPELKLFIAGNYFHAEKEADSYLRLTTTVCEVIPGKTEVKCLGSDYSGDVFAGVVKSNSIYHGKKVQMVQTPVVAVPASRGMDIAANYRLATGRNYLEDLDMRDPAQRKKYQAMTSPTVDVTCSVRNDAFGVVSAY